MNQDHRDEDLNDNDVVHFEAEQPTHRNVNYKSDLQFDIQYNNESDHEQQEEAKQELAIPNEALNQETFGQINPLETQEEHKESKLQETTMDEDDDQDPMERRLNAMKQELRKKMEGKDSEEKKKEADEDAMPYDGYKSPDRKHSNPPKMAQEELKETPAQPAQKLAFGIPGAANLDKIKNSKLFQKFLEKEQKASQPPALSSKQSETSLKNPSQQSSAEKRKQWNKKPAAAANDSQNISRQTHDDFFEQKLKVAVNPVQNLDGSHINNHNETDMSIEHHHNQFLDTSQAAFQRQSNADYHPYENFRVSNDQRAYVEDNDELNNEGELIGYSEQILGKINDLAPGVPTQDDVLIRQPPESFINLVHDQFNNEMPWIIQSHLKKSPVAQSQQHYTNAQQPFDAQRLEPLRQEMGNNMEEVMRMKNDYQFINERFTNLKEKHDQLQQEYNKDKNFYDEALEARMNQLEEMEIENENLKRRIEEQHHKEMEMQSRIDQLEFDSEMMQRQLGANHMNKDQLSKKEEDILKDLRESQEQLREKEFEIERVQNDEIRMRHQIERQAQEIERLKQQSAYDEETLNQKDHEKGQLLSQITESKQKLQQEQTEQHYIKSENEELRNEVMMVKQQLNMASNMQEQLKAQLFEGREKVQELEHKDFLQNSAKDMMTREIQSLKQQLNAANQFIQQQTMMYSMAAKAGGVPQQFMQPTNQSNYSSDSRGWMDQESTHSRESAVPNISPPQKDKPRTAWPTQQRDAYQAPTQQQVQQARRGTADYRSNNMGNLLAWEENQQMPVAHARTPVNHREEPAFLVQRQSTRNDPNVQSWNTDEPTSYGAVEDDRPIRSKKKEVVFEDAPMTREQPPHLKSKVMEKGADPDRRSKQIQNIENNLLQLNMEREKYSNELNKIPESAKTIAQRRRREDLEREMGILGRNISGLKAKLKELDAL